MFKRKDNQAFFSVTQITFLNLEKEFKKLVGKFSDHSTQIDDLSVFMLSKYGEKTRFYHNLSHVNALLFAAKEFKEKFTDYESIQFVVWFHDVIYVPQRQDNEAASAKLAVENLTQLNLPKHFIEKIEQIILATQKHDAANLDFDGKLFLDLDLGILGASENIYQNYKQAIRQEYSFVPWFLYRRARAKILANFLNREFIYFTGELRKKFEDPARQNIANEIKELS